MQRLNTTETYDVCDQYLELLGQYDYVMSPYSPQSAETLLEQEATNTTIMYHEYGPKVLGWYTQSNL